MRGHTVGGSIPVRNIFFKVLDAPFIYMLSLGKFLSEQRYQGNKICIHIKIIKVFFARTETARKENCKF